MLETLVEIKHIKDFAEQGFYSRTYLANDLRLKREVAVKDIDADTVESRDAVEKYFEEAQKLSIAAHPRVLPVYFVGLDNSGKEDDVGSPRIVTKFIKKGSLNVFLDKTFKTNKTLDLGSAIRFSHDVIQGMIHLHSLNIVHLDLKASNIFIGDDNKLIIADFGQSKILAEASFVQVQNLYPSIWTPESIKKKIADKTTDIYQFGVLLYCIFNFDLYRKAIVEDYGVDTKTLIKVFKDANVSKEEKDKTKANLKRLSQDIKNGEFPDRNAHHHYVPKVIRKVISKCLSVNVEDRYQNFKQIQEDINRLTISKFGQDLCQDLVNNTISFTKKGLICNITITNERDKFSVIAKKNGQRKIPLCKSNLTALQLSKHIEEITETI